MLKKNVLFHRSRCSEGTISFPSSMSNTKFFKTKGLPVVSQVLVVRVIGRQYLPAAGLVSADRLGSGARFLRRERHDHGARASNDRIHRFVLLMLLVMVLLQNSVIVVMLLLLLLVLLLLVLLLLLQVMMMVVMEVMVIVLLLLLIDYRQERGAAHVMVLEMVMVMVLLQDHRVAGGQDVVRVVHGRRGRGIRVGRSPDRTTVSEKITVFFGDRPRMLSRCFAGFGPKRCIRNAVFTRVWLRLPGRHARKSATH